MELTEIPGRIHFSRQRFEREQQAEHELMILLRTKGSKGAIPLSIEQADSISIKNINHMRIVSCLRGLRKRGTDIGTTEELHLRSDRRSN